MKKLSSNEVYYGKLSEMLEDLIQQRKIEAMSYEEYLRQVVELAQAILHPEEGDSYPPEIRNSSARRALYDFLESDASLATDIDHAIRISIRPFWRENFQKQQNVRSAIYSRLIDAGLSESEATTKTEEIFELAKIQEEYDQ